MLTLAELSKIQVCFQGRLEEQDYTQDEIDDIMQDLSACLKLVLEPAPEPEPEPEPDPAVCRPGWHPLGGFWSGFCGDDERNFLNEQGGAVGIMKTNADCGKIMRPKPTSWTDGRRGRASVEVFFDLDQLPQDLGGGHLFTACSGEKHQVADFLRSWFRPDIMVQGGQWRIDTYNNGPNGEAWKNGNHVVDVWRTGLVPTVMRWIPFSIEWERRSADTMVLKFTADGLLRERTVTIHPESVNPYYIMFGNEDHLEQFGGNHQIKFRNRRWDQF